MSIGTEPARGLASLPEWGRNVGGWLRRVSGRVSLNPYFTTLTKRIIVLNLVGFFLLLGGILYFSQYQAWLIDTHRKSLTAQGEIIAAFIASSTTSDAPTTESDGNGGAGKPATERERLEALRFSIRPNRIGPFLGRIIEPTGARARVYSLDGTLIVDSNALRADSGIVRSDLPPVGDTEPSLWSRLSTALSSWLQRTDLPTYRDIGSKNGKAYTEVQLALQGQTTPMLLVSEKGQHVVSVAVPIKRLKAVLGVLLLSTRAGEIDDLIAAERMGILKIGAFSLLAIALSSLLLAGTVALPLNKLAQAAERVQRSLKSREQLPLYANRNDEIGYLSRTLRAMTDALYRRIEESERFAADVAHELKNPLTSVRSAAETLAIVKTDAQRKQLADTIQHDVQRLTRLIDDISKATRADADMALAEARPVDIADLLATLTSMFNDTHTKSGQRIDLSLANVPLGTEGYVISGHDTRLGQVFTNLIDNALSFSPAAGTVWIKGRRERETLVITVEDQGPGIPDGNFERIFKRFYTDRPGAEQFGKNSGLGLSICRDIVTAHGGRIWAENRGEPESGARFTVELPVSPPQAPMRRPRPRLLRR